MKVSLNWLREYTDIPADVNELVRLLTFAGVEVEKIERRGVDIANVVVAQILSSEQHPNADRLSVCQVNDGSPAPRQIVCGAKNYVVGDKVPLALPGAVLPGDFKIKVGKLRGVESQGMLCSAGELELPNGADGLLILPADAPVGATISKAIPTDVVLEIEVTPNRPDLLGYVGIAREVAALTGGTLRDPRTAASRPLDASTIAVEISVPDRCALYTARRLHGIKVGPSPEWLQQRLESIGLRPVNNVVDITNFVLFETGQPLHAFDAAALRGGLEVRMARPSETLLALDGREYALRTEDLVIADSERTLAIAGVMGGEASSVTGKTTEIVLESAAFAASAIRRSSRALGLSSDSSYRFERGVDAAGVLPASDRAVDLLRELAGADSVEHVAMAGQTDAALREVSLRTARCQALLGAPVSAEEIGRILVGFGLRKVSGDDAATVWQVPSFRADLSREIDLIEEVCRVYGIERLPAGKMRRIAPESPEDRAYDHRIGLARRLAGLGFHEVRTLTLISEAMLTDDLFGNGAPLRVRNPLSEDHVVLRPGLTPGLMRVIASNVRQGLRDLRLFEIGRVFGGENEEEMGVALAWTGAVRPEGWREADVSIADFHHLRGVLEVLGISNIALERMESAKTPLAARVFAGGHLLGWIAQIAPARAREIDVTHPLLVAELRVDAMRQAAPALRAFAEIPRFPAITRDIAMLTPATLAHGEIESAIRAANESLLVGIRLFDVFTDPLGEKLPADAKSLAYSLTYRSSERTLTQDEVNAAHARLKEGLKSALSIQFRE